MLLIFQVFKYNAKYEIILNIIILTTKMNMTTLPLRPKMNISLKKKQGLKLISPNSSGTSNNCQYSQESSPTNKYYEQNSTYQTGHLQEFQKAYDLLRAQYQQKRKQVDDLTRDKKRLEVQLMNSNPQYYQKQIKRLKQQLEKYQFQNQDHKHMYFVAQNQKKDLEASVRIKSQEVKNIIKQLQKQKISVVELKHQISQKQKHYQRVKEELQKSNNSLQNNHDQLNKKVNKLESALRIKNTDLEQLQKNYDLLLKKNQENEKQLKQVRQLQERVMTTKQRQLQQYQKKLRETISANRVHVLKLQEQIEQYKKTKKTEQLLINQKIETANIFKKNRVAQLQMLRLEQENKHLSYQLGERNKYIKKLQFDLKNSCNKQQVQQLEKSLKQLEEQKNNLSNEYENKILKLMKQNENLKYDIMDLQENGKKTKEGKFESLLKDQIQQSGKYKNQLSLKVDEIFNLKSHIQEQKIAMKLLQNQIDILKKKIKSEEKNHKIQNDISSQNLKNQIDSLKRKLETTENKLSNKVRQIKEKDNFITDVIIGRSKQEDIPIIMADFQRIFEADYINKLIQANQKIKQLESKL